MSVEMLEGDLTPEWYNLAVSARQVGMDIETSGLNKNTDQIATVQMYVPNAGTVMVRKLYNPKWLIALLETPQTVKIFHHASFDLGFLVRDYPMYPSRIADTKVAAKILDPKKIQFTHPETGRGSHSLQTLVWYYFEDMLDKRLAVSNWFEETLSPEQLIYAAKDVEYLPELLRKLETEISAQGNLRLVRDAYNHIPTKVLLEIKNYEGVYEY